MGGIQIRILSAITNSDHQGHSNSLIFTKLGTWDNFKTTFHIAKFIIILLLESSLMLLIVC